MNPPIAVVVGLCAHGLQIVRSLHSAGVRVVALESNRDLPGVRTNCCEVRFTDDINGIELVDALKTLAESLKAGRRLVLFLTNDTMVHTVGSNYGKIEDAFQLSWQPCRDSVVRLLRKENIEKYNRSIGASYPKSIVINTEEDLKGLEGSLRPPIILKPDRPLSAYKTLLIHDTNNITASWPLVRRALPTIAQEFIPGDDENIYFGALYMDKGEVLGRFEGRKLRSRPMGHTTIAISEPSDQLYELTKDYFANLNFSGPCSLELKKDLDGKYWVLEPTVGRTDFWVGLCIRDGVNFPLIEYEAMVGESTSRVTCTQKGRTLWINGQRDPFAIFWLALKYPSHLISKSLIGVFISAKDYSPMLYWQYETIKRLPAKIKVKLLKVFSRVQAEL